MPFFHYSQNNSGGSFDLTDALTHHVVIEADTSSEADTRLESLGGYFNGCTTGRDCPCCGDRWHTHCGKGDDTARVYGHKASECMTRDGKFSGWMPAGKEIVVHYADGRQEWF